MSPLISIPDGCGPLVAHADEDVHVPEQLLRGPRIEGETRASPHSLSGTPTSLLPTWIPQAASRSLPHGSHL